MLTKRFRCLAAALLSAVLPCIGSATAWADDSIVIDLVRHGQSVANAEHLIDTSVPGTELTALGQQQAQAIANVLAPKGPYAGIFASQLIRTQQTALPLAALLRMNVQVLPGLNEINAGRFDGLRQFSLAGLIYLIGPVAWMLGLPFVPMLAPGSTDPNGFEFDKRFNKALQTMYANAATNAPRFSEPLQALYGNVVTNAKGFNNTLQMMYGSAVANPVRGADGKITEVAFSSEFVIGVGTMMNVKNPDPLLLLLDPLPPTGIVVIQGNPHDGWRLVSWNGKPVRPSLMSANRREAKGLCLMLDVPTENGPCATKPSSTASAPDERVPGSSRDTSRGQAGLGTSPSLPDV